MNFEAFKKDVAESLKVSEDDAMQELDANFPTALQELMDTGSVILKIGEKEYFIALKIEEVL